MSLLSGMIDLGMPWYFPSSVINVSIEWTVFALMFAMMLSKASMYFSLMKSVTGEEQCLVVVAFMMLSSRSSR